MHGTRKTARVHSELHAKSHRLSKRPPFEWMAFLLQGGGALRSYQAGVYEALAEANLHLNWVCVAAITILLVFGMTSGFAAPIERVADTAECKGIIARLLEATDASFDHYSASGEDVFFRNPKSVLSCTSHRRAGISLTWDTDGFPPNEWFGLLAKAGKAVTGADLNKLESASRQCCRSALKDKTKLADMEIPNAKIECQASTRDGGGVNISIWTDDALSVSPALNER